MRKHILTATFLSVFSAAAVAGAPGGEKDAAAAMTSGTMPSFEVVDRNEDGKISAEEAGYVRGLSVQEADRDGDGMLSPVEYKAAIEHLTKG